MDKARIAVIKKTSITLGIVWIVFWNVFGIYKIPSTSMVPTLMPGDIILVNKCAYFFKVPLINKNIYRFAEPKRADVVVFRAPDDTGKIFVKRMIASGGEQVIIKDGNIHIDGKEVVIPTIARNYYYNQGDYGSDPSGVSVESGDYFFLGDNSIASGDSRFWGFVSDKEIIGKAVLIWWPLARVNMIE